MDNTYNSDRLLAEIAGCFEMHSPLEDSVRRILERLSPFVGARSASVWLIENGFVRCIYSLDLEMEGFCLPAEEGIVGEIVQTGRPDICNEPDRDSSKSDKADDQLGYSTRNILSMPLFNSSGVVGALQLVDKSGPSRFDQADLELVEKAARILSEGISQPKTLAEIKERLDFLKKRNDILNRFERVVGRSPAMQQVKEQADIAARNEFPVLIAGETGTGKEILAKCIHENSRRSGPFIAENCAAVSQGTAESELFGHARGAFTGATRDRIGLIEAADGGTLFLDEIGETPASIQISLLRFLQEGEIRRMGEIKLRRVNTRLITATNQDLWHLVHEGTFRQDYFFRIRVFQIDLPPLRERGNDIVLLTRRFVQLEDKKRERDSDMQIDSSVYDLLRRHRFPGNVRELENAVANAYAYAEEDGVLRPEHFSRTTVWADMQAPHQSSPAISPLKQIARERIPLDRLEREYIEHVLEETGGKKGDAAGILGIHVNTLTRKLAKHRPRSNSK